MYKKLLTKANKMKENDPFLITFTFVNKKKKKDKFDTYLIANNFPYKELERTKEKVIRSIDKELEKGFSK